ncbi:hypothetical protein K1719_012860 [Acacia pycnantha]|nr:hypothetical protein K1719_012860 [Acacia pycnantha]
MEGDMDVEGVEVKKKNGVEVRGKGPLENSSRPNRQRRYVNPVPNQNLGSRFTVLNEAGGEEAAMGEAEKEVEGSRGEEWTSKGQGRGVSSVPNKAETRRVLGETNKGAVRGSGRSVGRSELEGRGDKESRRVNVLSEAKSGSVMRISKGRKLNYQNLEVGLRSNLEQFGGRKVNLNGKENLNPGDCSVKGGVKEGRTSTDLSQAVEDEDPNGGLDTSMEEECAAPAGAASKGVASVLRDMRSRYKASLVIILEPRISGVQASKTIKKWGFKHSVRKEAVGFSGGIWLLWEMDNIKVEVLRIEEQFVHCNLKMEGDEFLFSAIYANPNEHRRHELWEMLSSIGSEVNVPWLLAGHFNEIKTPLEQVGGGRVNESRCRRFNTWIQDCNLIDVKANGPFYTWKGSKWDGLERVFKRLDRCLCNVQWQERFANAEVKVVPRVCSDHHPLVVNLKVVDWGRTARQFRYEAVWKIHNEFESVMRNSWRGEEEVHVKLADLKQSLIRWNKEIRYYGNTWQVFGTRFGEISIGSWEMVDDAADSRLMVDIRELCS